MIRDQINEQMFSGGICTDFYLMLKSIYGEVWTSVEERVQLQLTFKGEDEMRKQELLEG